MSNNTTPHYGLYVNSPLATEGSEFTPNAVGYWQYDANFEAIDAALWALSQGSGGGAVASVFGRAGTVVAEEGDYAAFYAAPLVPNKTLYVDNTRTDSFTPNGTIAFPFATITAAINQVIANGDNATYTYLIDIQPSVYAETINIGNASLYNLMFEGHGGAAAAYASSGTPMPGAIVHPASGNALQGTSNVDQIEVLQFSGLTFLGPVDITDASSDNLGANGFAFVNCCFQGNVTVTAASGYMPVQFISSAIGYNHTLTLEYVLVNWINSDMNWGTANFSNMIIELVSWAFNPQNLNIGSGAYVTGQDGMNIGAETVTVENGGHFSLINAIVIANLVINSGGTVTNYLGAIEGTITNNGTYTIAGTATNFSADIMNAGTGFRINSAAASGHYLRGNGTNYIDGTIQSADVPTLNQNTTGTAANLSGTPALPNGTTATTQTAGDSTNKLATDAFVSAAVAVETARAEAEEAMLASIISGLGSEFLALAGGTMSGTINMNENEIVWENASLGIDTSLSRVAAGVLGIGTGAQGSIAGSLSLANATNTSVNATPGTASSTAGFVLLQNTTPTVTGASTTLAIKTGTAPINVTGNTWRYTFAVTETGAGSNAWVGASVTISGYTTTATGNNGTFVIIASTTTTFDVVNATGTTADGGTPVVISSAVVNSPILQIAGTVNTGTAGTLNSVADVWSIQNVLGSVAPNPTSTLTFAHSGTGGPAVVSIPNLALVGAIYYSSELSLYNGTPASSTLEFVAQAAQFRGSNLATIGFSAGAPNVGAADTAISRISAGVLGIGNGTAGDFTGSLKLTNITMGSSPVLNNTSGNLIIAPFAGIVVENTAATLNAWLINPNLTPPLCRYASTLAIAFSSGDAVGTSSDVQISRSGAGVLAVGTTYNNANPALGTLALSRIDSYSADMQGSVSSAPTGIVATNVVVAVGAATATFTVSSTEGFTVGNTVTLSAGGWAGGSGLASSTATVTSIANTTSMVLTRASGGPWVAGTYTTQTGTLTQTGGTSVSVIYAVAYTSTPTVVASPTSNCGTWYISASSNTGFTITYANSGTQTFNYHVMGNPT